MSDQSKKAARKPKPAARPIRQYSIYVLQNRRPSIAESLQNPPTCETEHHQGNDLSPEILQLDDAPELYVHSLTRSPWSTRPSKTGGLILDADVSPQEVPAEIFERSVENLKQTAQALMLSLSGIHKDYAIDTVKLKLTLDADVGLAFIGKTGIEAAIEISIQRKDSTSRRENAAADDE